MRFLIIKTSSLGDIIQSFDALAYLRVKFPEAKIDWVAEKPYSSILSHHPYVDRLIVINTKKWKLFRNVQEIARFYKQLRSFSYDAVFDLQGNCKSGLVSSLARSSHKVGFGRKSVREKPAMLAYHHHYNLTKDLNIRQKYLNLIQLYFNDAKSYAAQPFLYRIDASESVQLARILKQSPQKKHMKVMVCPGSKWKNKQLTLQTWKELLAQLNKDYKPYYYFMWGSLKEKELSLDLNQEFSDSVVVEKLELHVWQRLMASMDVVFAVDSSALHLCATTTTPSLSIFGPTRSAIFKPQGDFHLAVQGQCPYGKDFVKQCPILRTCKTGACIRDLSSNDIYEQFSAWWQKASKSR